MKTKIKDAEWKKLPRNIVFIDKQLLTLKSIRPTT